jgi:hypothetical protein
MPNPNSARRRQPEPPFYTLEQLDALCEQIIMQFCMDRYGQELNPVPTQALLQLLEEHAHDVDQLAQLPEGVHGVTLYYCDRKPDVKISADLTRQHWREVRQRTTITHECAHAIQHAPLWRGLGNGPFVEGPISQSCRCEYSEHLLAQWDDRMEFQARYMSGSFLMLKSRVQRLAQKLADTKRMALPVDPTSSASIYLIEHMVVAFHVSRDAAAVRLKRLGLMK